MQDPQRLEPIVREQDAIAELGVGLHDGVLGALRFFPALATLAVRGVDLRPPRREEDRISITMPFCLLDQRVRKRVADEIGAGEGIADTAIEVDGSLRAVRSLPLGGLCAVGGDRSLH